MRVVFGSQVVDTSDVGVPQRHPHLGLALKLIPHQLSPLGLVTTVPAAEDLDGKHLAGGPLDGPIDPREGTTADEIEHFVIAVKEAGLFARHQPRQLVAGQQLAADQHLFQFAGRDVTRPQRAPDFLKLLFADQLQIDRGLGDLLTGRHRHLCCSSRGKGVVHAPEPFSRCPLMANLAIAQPDSSASYAKTVAETILLRPDRHGGRRVGIAVFPEKNSARKGFRAEFGGLPGYGPPGTTGAADASS